MACVPKSRYKVTEPEGAHPLNMYTHTHTHTHTHTAAAAAAEAHLDLGVLFLQQSEVVLPLRRLQQQPHNRLISLNLTLSHTFTPCPRTHRRRRAPA